MLMKMQETGKELSSKLFMSDKKRPVWDLDYMMEIGLFQSVCPEGHQ